MQGIPRTVVKGGVGCPVVRLKRWTECHHHISHHPHLLNHRLEDVLPQNRGVKHEGGRHEIQETEILFIRRHREFLERQYRVSRPQPAAGLDQPGSQRTGFSRREAFKGENAVLRSWHYNIYEMLYWALEEKAKCTNKQKPVSKFLKSKHLLISGKTKNKKVKQKCLTMHVYFIDT